MCMIKWLNFTWIPSEKYNKSMRKWWPNFVQKSPYFVWKYSEHNSDCFSLDLILIQRDNVNLHLIAEYVLTEQLL